jgi:S-adenosylmethionine:tRNA ribosyltransferase-isomerase
MRVSDFDYQLPPGHIALEPVEPRDHARLMAIDRASGDIVHATFRDLVTRLRPGDLMVVNDSRVIPARIRGVRADSGGSIEALLLRPTRDPYTWSCLVRGRVKQGSRLRFTADGRRHVEAEVLDCSISGERILRFESPPYAWMADIGHTPLPPYLRASKADAERYQTVYARVDGSAAAPTAGLHFTPELIAKLRDAGIAWASITLHIGLDTFRPLQAQTDLIEDHRMHSEWMAISHETASLIEDTRRRGARVIAVGTTTVRALETAADWAREAGSASAIAPGEGWSDKFLRPGSDFEIVDGLITNFHLPRSSLLMLVSAFAGKALVERAYRIAIEHGYRFYSFGDAMLIT